LQINQAIQAENQLAAHYGPLPNLGVRHNPVQRDGPSSVKDDDFSVYGKGLKQDEP